jgi:ribosomal-protein-alanine acetyltransferase
MLELERDSPPAAHWSQSQYESIFAPVDSPRSERRAWVAEEEGTSLHKDAPTLLAFLVAHRVNAEWELENIVVAATNRREGLGTLLLREFISHVKGEHGSSIFLEVRDSNLNARNLYRKQGFEETGLRKRYYAEPPEDAILCRLRLC